MPKLVDLVVIDPQNSFCKIVDAADQQKLHDGELCVTGAWDDMLRVAALVKRLDRKLNDIHVTLDSHHLLHVAHPVWFRSASKALQHPDPFTLMRVENGVIIGSRIDANGNQHDVGEFTTTRPSALKRTVEYLNELAARKRYPHCIWPPHCLIGTPGHNVVAPLMESLLDWCQKNNATVDFVTKGSHPYVEHFSAVQAEVPDPQDPATQINTAFIKTLMKADEVVFAGEAGSHCLANTVSDIANYFSDDSFVKKCVLLIDATSPVPGFESYQDNFIKEMTGRGMKTSTVADYLA